MQFITGVTGSLAAGATNRRQPDSTPAVPHAEPSRALVPLRPPVPNASPMSTGSRSYAPFLAQLIATAEQMPQTRARRRAGFAEADMAYSAADAAPASSAVLRSV